MDTLAVTFARMDAVAACEIAGWRYEGAYATYDMVDSMASMLDPANDFHVARDAAGVVVGFCCFGADARVPGGRYAEDALDVGFGLRPDLTGRGLGASFVEAVLAYARARHAPRLFRLTVATFNQRAIRVYERLGFVAGESFTSIDPAESRPFVVMTRLAQSSEGNQGERPS